MQWRNQFYRNFKDFKLHIIHDDGGDGELSGLVDTCVGAMRDDPAHLLAGYMAYETVAQIVDLALLVRHDSLARPGMPFSRYLPGAGYSTSHTLDSQQVRRVK
jgi:hypothetical protein